MNDLGNKEVFSKNLKYYMNLNQTTREELSKYLEVPYATVSSWCTGSYYPRIDKIEKLARFFNINKSDLVESKASKQANKDKLLLIPIVGRIAAGEPILAEENIEGYLPIEPTMYGIDSSEELFFLRVVGESMNKLVQNGSFVLVRKQDAAESGDVVVAIVNDDNEATLKQFKQLDTNFVMLEPKSTYEEFMPRTINLKEDEFKIIGKVIGDFKKW